MTPATSKFASSGAETSLSMIMYVPSLSGLSILSVLIALLTFSVYIEFLGPGTSSASEL